MEENIMKNGGHESRIRQLQPEDRSRVEEIIFLSGEFNEEEKVIALELVDEALAKGEKSGYVVAVLEERKEHHTVVQGYVCYGPTPLTQGVFDLYWIAVDPEVRGMGFGRVLIQYVEQDVVERGGRMLLIETSSCSRVTTVRQASLLQVPGQDHHNALSG